MDWYMVISFTVNFTQNLIIIHVVSIEQTGNCQTQDHKLFHVVTYSVSIMDFSWCNFLKIIHKLGCKYCTFLWPCTFSEIARVHVHIYPIYIQWDIIQTRKHDRWTDHYYSQLAVVSCLLRRHKNNLCHLYEVRHTTN